MANETTTKVLATKIIGTRVTVFSAWEPYNGHTTITHIDGVRYGRVGCAALPAELAAMRAMSDERYVAVKAWHASEYERAYTTIVAERPDAAAGSRDMGEITTVAAS